MLIILVYIIYNSSRMKAMNDVLDDTIKSVIDLMKQ